MRQWLADREDVVRNAKPGSAAARALCALTDEVVRRLADASSPHISERWAIVALGGWGAGALLPKSDLDILVLSDAKLSELKPFVEGVLYPLWDVGLKVGHQVRSPKQQLKAMRSDLKTCTAALTARPLCGDTAWARVLVESWLADGRRRQRRLLSALASRPRPGSPYLLELNLKESAGGRRDYDELVWTAAVLTGYATSDPGALVGRGLLTAQEFAAVTYDAGVVASARWELQREGFGDMLTVEAGHDLFSVTAEQVQEAVAETALILGRVRSRLAEKTSAAAIGEQEPPLGPDDVFGLLARGEEGLPSLEEAAQAGLLDPLVPGFRSLMTCRRPGLGHQLTVGAHSLRAAALVTSPPASDVALASSLAALVDSRPVQVAALCHDSGKAEAGPGHEERGALHARETAARFGLDAPSAELVSALVRHHLVLAETALRFDLNDEDTVLRAVRTLGDDGLVAPLHLLTAADSRATGPSSWTPWTSALIDSLVSRLELAFSPSVDGAGIAESGEAVRTRSLEAMEARPLAEKDFVASAPLRYLASRTPEQVARDASLFAELAGSPPGDHVRVAVSSGPSHGTCLVTVAALDRSELLARVAGAVALSGMDILSVDAYSANGVALDALVVRSATGRALATESFAQLERRIRAALRDRLDLVARLEERRRHYPSKADGDAIVRTERVGWATALQVTAPDRVGLLHDVAHAVSLSNLDIRWARIQTIDGIARDTFHLVGEDGGPVDDPGVLGHVCMNVRAAL